MSGNQNSATNMPEFLRKIIVHLKRKPQTIPMLALVIAFLIYSLNLTNISHTTSRIQGSGMGLYGFITMLLSMLSFVCFTNAYPNRKPINKPMFILMLVMIGIIIFADIQYRGLIHTALNRAENPIAMEPYIDAAYKMLFTHICTLIISVVLILIMPVYARALRSIRTSIDVEDNGGLAEIDISGEN